MKKISINGTEYILFGAGENAAVSIYPHMIEAASGEIPKGKQLGLLKGFLEANGVTLIDNANTHWCVEAAIADAWVSEILYISTKNKNADFVSKSAFCYGGELGIRLLCRLRPRRPLLRNSTRLRLRR